MSLTDFGFNPLQGSYKRNREEKQKGSEGVSIPYRVATNTGRIKDFAGLTLVSIPYRVATNPNLKKRYFRFEPGFNPLQGSYKQRFLIFITPQIKTVSIPYRVATNLLQYMEITSRTVGFNPLQGSYKPNFVFIKSGS